MASGGVYRFGDGRAESILKEIQFFGIESADEGELSNNLGTNVLSQLKTIFGSCDLFN